MPGFVLKKKRESGGKTEVVCRLVRLLQEYNSKSDIFQKESSGANGEDGASPRRQKKVKRESEASGKLMKRKEGRVEMEKGEGGPEIELLEFSTHEEANHDLGLKADECENSNSPVCNTAALMALFGDELSVGKSDVSTLSAMNIK